MAGATLTQKTYLLMADERGELPKASLTPEVCFVGTVFATLMDEGLLALTKAGTVVVRGELPDDLKHLSEVFEYVRRKQPSIRDFAKRFNSVLTGKHSGKLVEAVGASLAEMDMAHEVKKTITGRRRYAPDPEAKQVLLDGIRTAMLEGGEKTPGIVALSVTLDRAEMLDKYFTKEEKLAIMKANDKALGSSDAPRALIQMVQYVKYVTFKIAIMPLLSNDENKYHPKQ